MNIAIIGVGGVGGYFGGKLAIAAKENPTWKVFFVARGNHLKAIQETGLVLDSDEGRFVCQPYSALEDISALPKLDYCMICVKGYDLEQVLLDLREKISKSTVVLPLLNGVDIHERIRSSISFGYIHPACVYVGTHIDKPGTVKQRGGACTIFLGNDPEVDAGNNAILSILDRAKIKYIWMDDPFIEIWSKYIFIASFGLVTADSNFTLGELVTSQEHLGLVQKIAEEIIALAQRKGISLPGTILSDTMQKAGKFLPETKTSFQRDYERYERKDERDLFGGSIVRMGRQLGVSTVSTEMVSNSLERKKPSI